MKARRIELTTVGRHESAVLELPAPGLVLLSGRNGEGKSTFVEAVARGGWGESLRPKWAPWRKGQAGVITIDDGRLRVVRRATDGGREHVSWNFEGQAPTKWESPTLAQAALEAEIGNFEVWHRCSVFSPQDAAHFTEARDAERKRLLESLLGLAKFDSALKQCRRDLKVRREQRAKDDQTRLLTSQKRDSAAQRRAEAQAGLEIVPTRDTRDFAKLIGAVKSAITSYKQALPAMDRAVREATRAHADAKAEHAQQLARLKRLAEGTCGECHRPIAAHAVDEERRCLGAAPDGEAVRAAELDLEDARAEERALQNKLMKLEADRAAAVKAAPQRDMLEKIVASATADLSSCEAELTEVAKRLAEHDARIDVLEAVDQVLGTKGVRSYVMANVLSNLELLSNLYLRRLTADPVRLTLRPYTEQKNGAVEESIDLDITPWGGGYGYWGCSGGERRRINVALLLALSRIAGAAHGRTETTLWFDEPFDSLDEEGLQGVVVTLEEMAQERGVVVITHRQDLQRMLRPTRHYHIEDHVLRRVA